MTLKAWRFATLVSSLAAVLAASACSYEKSPSVTAPTSLEEASGGAPAVSANRTPDPEEGTRLVGGHCGGNPTPIWNDVTDVTFNSGTVGRWTGRGRF